MKIFLKTLLYRILLFLIAVSYCLRLGVLTMKAQIILILQAVIQKRRIPWWQICKVFPLRQTIAILAGWLSTSNVSTIQGESSRMAMILSFLRRRGKIYTCSSPPAERMFKAAQKRLLLEILGRPSAAIVFMEGKTSIARSLVMNLEHDYAQSLLREELNRLRRKSGLSAEERQRREDLHSQLLRYAFHQDQRMLKERFLLAGLRLSASED